VWPFRPYYELCGTYQSWRMFTGAPHVAGRLCIDVRERGRWRAVYVERDAELTWLDDWLSHHRVRPAVTSFAGGLYPDDYRQFAAWLATQAARDFPGARQVRVRYLLQRIPAPAEARAGARPAGEYDHVLVLPLSGAPTAGR
jgi:hypothetical protein